MMEQWMHWDTWLYDPSRPLLFNSGQFLVLFFLFYAGYIALKAQHRLRVLYVVGFSLYFYYKCSGFYFGLLIFSSVIDYSLSNWIYRSENKRWRALLLLFSCLINLGLLGYFKYTGFLLDNWNQLTDGSWSVEAVFLPIGISFYTFQTMSHTIDIYRKELTPAKSLMDFMFFVSFFPQLVAGPIVRASDFIPQMYKRLGLTRRAMSWALFLIMGGLLKKAVISDYLSVNFVDRVFAFPDNYSAFENLLAVYGYTLQIYCDFSGYSDIAIGLALLLGFKLPANFRTPYQSSSITEFWRRWHISLSSWLRDYLYISLGGNRKGQWRTYLHLFLTMLLGGLWHGASWKFVFWGAVHGAVLAIERVFRLPQWYSKNRLTRFLGWGITFHIVAFCWVFFRARDFATANQILVRIQDMTWDVAQWWQVLQGYSHVSLLLLIGGLWHSAPERWQEVYFGWFNLSPFWFKAMSLGLVFWVVYATASSDVQPFIYFQF